MQAAPSAVPKVANDLENLQSLLSTLNSILHKCKLVAFEINTALHCDLALQLATITEFHT